MIPCRASPKTTKVCGLEVAIKPNNTSRISTTQAISVGSTNMMAMISRTLAATSIQLMPTRINARTYVFRAENEGRRVGAK